MLSGSPGPSAPCYPPRYRSPSLFSNYAPDRDAADNNHHLQLYRLHLTVRPNRLVDIHEPFHMSLLSSPSILNYATAFELPSNLLCGAPASTGGSLFGGAAAPASSSTTLFGGFQRKYAMHYREIIYQLMCLINVLIWRPRLFHLLW